MTWFLETEATKFASFTGHRPKEIFGTYDMDNPRAKLLAHELKKEIERLIVEDGVDAFISGGALGTDQIAFICVHQLKKKYPHIKNILAVPYEDQANGWEEQLEKARLNKWKKAISDLELTLKRYEKIVEVADEVVYVDTFEKYQPKNMKPEHVGRHSNPKLQMRNIFMVDHSEIVIAVYNGSGKGGTFNCYEDARKKNKHIIVLDPNNEFKVKKNAS